MQKRTLNYESLNRHNVTEEECNQVTEDDNRTTEEFDEDFSSDGNWRLMFVGFSKAGRLLEIGVEFIKIEHGYWTNIYHADDATPAWQRRYNERKGK